MIDYLKYWSDIEKSLDFIRDTYTLPNDIIEDDEVSTIDMGESFQDYEADFP